MLVLPAGQAALAVSAGAVVAAAAVAFALLAGTLRRIYRHASQATRLVMAFAGVLTPLLVCYPLGAATSDRLTRHVIETDYAPSIARHPQDLRAALTRAQQEIDHLTSLPDLVSGLPSNDTQAAFLVWNQTGLSQARVISDIEMYGQDRSARLALRLESPGLPHEPADLVWTHVRVGGL